MENVVWKNSHIQAFWKDIAPCDHLVQVYENEKIFLDTLEGFAGTGLIHDESVVIIATRTHLDALENRLRHQRFNMDEMKMQNRYIAIDADEILTQFMSGNWPDEAKFQEIMSEIITRAQGPGNRKVRAFGEMVAVLWERGLKVATVFLEGLWEQLRDRENFMLFCAYPHTSFHASAPNALESICKTHSKVIDGKWHPSTEIYYRSA